MSLCTEVIVKNIKKWSKNTWIRNIYDIGLPIFLKYEIIFKQQFKVEFFYL